MDKNNIPKGHSAINEKRNVFKKPTIYVILLLCICIAAGTVTYLNSARKQSSSAVKNVSTNTKDKSVAKVSNNSNNKVSKGTQNDKTSMENANLVKKNTEKSKDSVSANANVQQKTMVAPVNGNIALGYTGTDGSMAVGLDKVSRTILGEYIKVSSKGVPVYAVMDGTVSSIEGGKLVLLTKNNNLQVVYDNLEPTSITLKKGDTVTQNSKIGVIGDSDNAKDRIVDCDHLYFEVDEKQSDGSYKDVNPQNYIKY